MQQALTREAKRWPLPLLLIILAFVGAVGVASIRHRSAEELGSVRLQQGDDPAWATLDYDDQAWHAAYWRSADPQGRLIWLRARVGLRREEAENGPLAVHVGALASYEVYWNGELIGRNGIPGTSRASEVVGPIDGDFPIPREQVRERGNLLALRLSAFHAPLRVAEPLQKLSVTKLETGMSERLRNYLISIFVAGAVLLAGIVAVFTQTSRGSNHHSTSLGFAAAAYLVLLVIESARAIVDYPYDWQLWRLGALSAVGATFGSLLVSSATNGRSRLAARLSTAVLVWSMFSLALLPSWDSKLASLLCGALTVAACGAWVNSDVRTRSAAVMLVVAAAAIVGAAVSPGTFVDQYFYVLAGVDISVLALQPMMERALSIVPQVATASSELRQIPVLSARGAELCDLDSVVAITGADDYAEIETENGVRRLHRGRLYDLENRLASHFKRVHRSNIVNTRHVRELILRPNVCLRMSSGLLVPVSRRYRLVLKAMFADTPAGGVGIV